MQQHVPGKQGQREPRTPTEPFDKAINKRRSNQQKHRQICIDENPGEGGEGLVAGLAEEGVLDHVHGNVVIVRHRHVGRAGKLVKRQGKEPLENGIVAHILKAVLRQHGYVAEGLAEAQKIAHRVP